MGHSLNLILCEFLNEPPSTTQRNLFLSSGLRAVLIYNRWECRAVWCCVHLAGQKGEFQTWDLWALSHGFWGAMRTADGFWKKKWILKGEAPSRSRRLHHTQEYIWAAQIGPNGSYITEKRTWNWGFAEVWVDLGRIRRRNTGQHDQNRLYEIIKK